MKNQFNKSKTLREYIPLMVILCFCSILFTGCATFQSEICWKEESSREASVAPLQISIYKLNKLILIKGEARGESGYFIFDTGAPGLVLNEAHFPDYYSDPSHKLSGVNGQLQDAKVLFVQNLKLGEVNFKHQYADVIDLSHIEQSRNVKILGLLGVNLFRGVELEINLKKHQLKIFKTDRDGNRLLPIATTSSADLITMPFKYSGALIELKAEINHHYYRIAFDTGSETLLLDKGLVGRDSIYTSLISNQSLLTTDGSRKDIEIRQLEKIKIGLDLHKVTTLTTDFKKLKSHGLNIDGLIGYDLMASGVVTINFKNRQLRIQPYSKA